ncbi:MarR family winged helix-turn-helix transcriptional regulator [Henriciella aquimarina]|uniref:MarR family winged helix-turn-helix transcriptional regulator n=1 Tax=Henriciella aquimarina TaxID=545261 RepID=UPI0009FEBFE1|nr:MarR family winged helix-turn-helix transcriptional regulator [Henriciella aquimarina]
MDQKTTDALIALRRIQRRTELYARSLAQATGLSVSQLKVLQLLSGPGAATAGELVQMTALSNASITSLIGKLEARKLVARTRDPEDGRRVVIALQPKGYEMLRNSPNPLQDHFELLFTALPEWEQSMIVSALERVAQIVDARSEITDSEPILDVGLFDEPVAP